MATPASLSASVQRRARSCKRSGSLAALVLLALAGAPQADEGLILAQSTETGSPGPGTGAPQSPGRRTEPSACDYAAPSPALDADAIAGTWRDPRAHAIVDVEQKDPKTPTEFVLHGSHDWEGSLKDGKLTFTRKPTVEEMSHTAPEWARKAVEGQLTWSIELEPKLQCTLKLLEGKWYPGRIRIDEQEDSDGKLVKQEATLDGKGDPTDIRYEAPPPEIQLLAQTVAGPIKVTRFFQGVPTVVEAVFADPQRAKTQAVKITVAGSEVTLAAKRDPQDLRRFVTDIVVAGQDRTSGGRSQ